jgi:thiamine phosphate synthase YjbQ (UPF0047 family)
MWRRRWCDAAGSGSRGSRWQGLVQRERRGAREQRQVILQRCGRR